MEFVEVISEPSGELVLEELPVAAPIMEEAINVEVPPHIGWFYDIDAEDVTAETLLQASEHDLRLAFMKLYEHLREGYFELIPRDPNGLIQRVFPDTGRRQELRQKLVRVFGQVKILEDLSEPRARYNFTEEFKDRHLRHFLHSTHTAEDEIKINWAYWCLEDEERRLRYDKYGEAGVGTSETSEQQLKENGGPMPQGFGGFGGAGGGAVDLEGVDVGDLFEAFFGGGGGSPFGSSGFGGGRRAGASSARRNPNEPME
eukprot:gene11040-12032_t